jgi:hypothetical protein
MSIANESLDQQTLDSSKITVLKPKEVIGPWAPKQMKIRPKFMTLEEEEEQQKLFFELPRKSCEQIAPEILRLKLNPSQKEQTRRLNIIKKILKKNKVKNVTQQMQHIIEFDKSDAIIPHGETSKHIYQELLKLRDFDLYGAKMPKAMLSEKRIEELQIQAQQLGIEYTQINYAEPEAYVPNIFENITDDLKAPPLRTEAWNLDKAEYLSAPMGFSRNPTQPFASWGNEIFFSYDGQWKDGKMHGHGKYLYDDKVYYGYQGQYEHNKPNGEGKATYTSGGTYEGNWEDSKYSGKGRTTAPACGTFEGAVFEGEFYNGKRHGIGKLELDCGLTYEGEWVNGEPHGRGVMISKSTGYAYDGDWERGSIRGSGAIILPDGKRVVRTWSAALGNFSLPGAVHHYIEDMERMDRQDQERSNEIFGPLRYVQLKNYVTTIRTALHAERSRVKREFKMKKVEEAKEQQRKILEARMAALAQAADERERAAKMRAEKAKADKEAAKASKKS